MAGKDSIDRQTALGEATHWEECEAWVNCQQEYLSDGYGK